MPNQIPPFYEIPLRPDGPMSSGSRLSMSLNGAQPNGSPQRLALDNLIRRELNVADPGDPTQVAQALLSRYQNDPRARAIDQEAQGLPFLPAVRSASPMSAAPTSSDNELALAMADVEKGLRDLTTNPLLKDVTPELQGWADAVRSAIQAGSTAARFAMDARQRDKAIAMRRTLGDYARVARLVGALSPGMNPNYRAFAQSLDEAAAVILVMTGDAISNVGLNHGQFLLQAPYTELQTRRDAVIYALRNLIGATQQAYGPDDWPRGLDAYRRLYDVLERQGQGDLRSLLVETELARAMDALIQRAANGTADGLRAVGATAQVDLEQFRRLVIIGRNAVRPPEPPLTAFLEGLRLFVDAFDTAGGIRLVNIARPAILFYGLYSPTLATLADARLQQLIIQRGQLADQLDGFLTYTYNPALLQAQIVLDKILYDVDRAIDLYAVGRAYFGAPERRASSYGYLINWLRSGASFWPGLLAVLGANPQAAQIDSILVQILSQLWPPLDPNNARLNPLVTSLVNVGNQFNVQIPVLNSRGAAIAIPIPVGTLTSLQNLTTAYSQILPALVNPTLAGGLIGGLTVATAAQPSREVIRFMDVLLQELDIQHDLEDRWQQLVQTIANDFIRSGQVFSWINQAIDGAIGQIDPRPLAIRRRLEAIRIPPQFETSLQRIDRKI
jgi:hypothetical protein